jgi:hypothetical protein
MDYWYLFIDTTKEPQTLYRNGSNLVRVCKSGCIVRRQMLNAL